jgi:membrane carboxypeptidase/penicillin-binding protein PbpC
MADDSNSQRYESTRELLTRMVAEQTIDESTAKEVLEQVRVFEKRFPTADLIPPGMTILAMSNEIIQATSLQEALSVAEQRGIEQRPYYCEQTARIPANHANSFEDPDISGGPTSSPRIFPALGPRASDQVNILVH